MANSLIDAARLARESASRLITKAKENVMPNETQPRAQCWLYKGGASQLFTGVDAIADAKKSGWKEEPSAPKAKAGVKKEPAKDGPANS